MSPTTLTNGGRNFTRALNNAVRQTSDGLHRIWTTLQVDRYHQPVNVSRTAPVFSVTLQHKPRGKRAEMALINEPSGPVATGYSQMLRQPPSSTDCTVTAYVCTRGKDLLPDMVAALRSLGFSPDGGSQSHAGSSGDGPAPKQAIARPTQLRGDVEPDPRALKRQEDQYALGGMRRPDLSAIRLPAATGAGHAVKACLASRLETLDPVLWPASSVMQGKGATPFTPEFVAATQQCLLRTMGAGQSDQTTGISAQMIEAYCLYTGDPDGVLADWIRSGAPLGVVNEITHTGVFPRVLTHTKRPEDLLSTEGSLGGWANYVSAECEPEISGDILRKMVAAGWATRHSTKASLVSELGAPDFVLNKLALISRMRSDGTMKHRLIWDLLRSGVNELIAPGERIILPRLNDLVDDVLDLQRACAPHEHVVLFGTDIADAFHQVPLSKAERKFSVVSINGDYYVFKVLVFGSGSAPTVWGRYAALLGRSLSSIFGAHSLRTEVYVDDPVFAARGTDAVISKNVSMALLWLLSLGFPISWAKTEGGNSIRWIGADIRVHPEGCDIVIPADKATQVLEDVMAMLQQKAVPVRKMQQLAGKLNFFAGIIPLMRPFLATIWAAIAAALYKGNNEGNTGRTTPGAVAGPDTCQSSRRYVQTRRCVHGLRWCAAFLRGQRGSLSRSFFKSPPEPDRVLTISVDASPWGLGGILCRRSEPIAWFASPLQQPDLDRFSAKQGDSAHTTLWELLAVLVAIKAWRTQQVGLTVALRSDSLGALSIIAKGSSRNAGVALVAAELQLELAEFSVHISTLTHIPGISNSLPDSLSRLWAPEKCKIPQELKTVERTWVPLRNAEFWRSSHDKPPHCPRTAPSSQEAGRELHDISSPDGPLLPEGRAQVR